MKAVGAYIFAGGFTLGVREHFDVDCVLEEGPYGVPTMRHNQPDIPVHVGFDAWPLEHLKEAGIIDFVYGNPPCAAWSVAGKSAKTGVDWRLDPRVKCTRAHFTLLEELRPRAWAWESVIPAFERGRELVDELTLRAIEMGYQATYLLHNAQFLGVPQQRRRFFCLFTDCHFDLDGIFEASRNADDVLRTLNDPGDPLDKNIGKYPDLIPRVRAGESLSNAWQRHTPQPWPLNASGQVANRPAFTIVRCRANQPAQVVMHEMIHPTEDRGLSIKELATLCGYPPGYEFIGARDAGQVGRGVCPPVGAWLARNVKRALELNRPINAKHVQLIDCREGGIVRTEYLPIPAQRALPPPPDPAVPPTPGPVVRGPTTREVVRANIAAKAKREGGFGSGQYTRELLARKRWTDQEILDAVRAHYVGSKATQSDISWNRARLVKESTAVDGGAFRCAASTGDPIPSPRELLGRLDAPGTAVMPVAVEPGVEGEPMTIDAEPVTNHNEPVANDSERQPARVRQSVDPSREFDKTSLRENSHGQWIHRDYLAHAFRWGFAGRFVTSETDVLDVGCGPDIPMINTLTMPRNQVPKSYVGVDLNREPQRHPTRQWATLHWQFNFLERFTDLGQFDLVLNFEMIEHMQKGNGQRLLRALRFCLRPTGRLLLSTPVFNGKAAANHIHEWTIPELEQSIQEAGMVVERRFGTFASQRDLAKVAHEEDLQVAKRLRDYYSDEVVACFLAPLYPDASRNNIWLIRLPD